MLSGLPRIADQSLYYGRAKMQHRPGFHVAARQRGSVLVPRRRCRGRVEVILGSIPPLTDLSKRGSYGSALIEARGLRKAQHLLALASGGADEARRALQLSRLPGPKTFNQYCILGGCRFLKSLGTQLSSGVAVIHDPRRPLWDRFRFFPPSQTSLERTAKSRTSNSDSSSTSSTCTSDTPICEAAISMSLKIFDADTVPKAAGGVPLRLQVRKSLAVAATSG